MDARVLDGGASARDPVAVPEVEPARTSRAPACAGEPAAGDGSEQVLSRLKVHPPYLLFVGTLEPRKNLIRLIRAYRRAATSGIPHSLVLAGPLGWRRQQLHRELALRGAGEVLLTGELSEDDIHGLYQHAAGFIVQALYEGFGLP